ncbi:hypothetical protein C0V78_09175 [Novosphingobium sp. TH158]|nr:hypothetical protein C0V78_09175 [Novosphingobium sp. TH158]
MAFANAAGESDIVSAANPLPVASAPQAAPAPLAGTANLTGTVGPFLPVPGRPVMLSLSGTWSGQVQILRSTDGGTVKLPLTALGQPYGSYTANLCEPVWDEGEAGAALYLQITLASGSLAYRMGQ